MDAMTRGGKEHLATSSPPLRDDPDAENGPPLPHGETFKILARHFLAFRLSPLQFSLQVRNEVMHEVDVSFQGTLPTVSDITLFSDDHHVILGVM